MKRQLVAALLALMLVICSALTVFTVADMGRVWGDGAVCSIGAQSSRDLSLLTALYPDLKWTAYAQSAPLTLAGDELPTRTAEAAMLSFLGSPGRIAFFPLASGRLPLDGESGACALDRSTAFELFKSTNVEGNLIRLDGKTVSVVGVMDVDRPLVLAPAGRDTKLNRLAADDRDAMLLLASALRAPIDPFELSGAELSTLARLLCIIPWLLIAAPVLASLRGRGGWWRVAGAMSLWALALGAVLAILWCVSVRLLPARWSDFSFYGEQAAAFRARPFRAPDVRDELIKWDMLRAGGWCAAACMALWMERMWLRCEKSHGSCC
ncbi:MAG: ABC transporter permease [Clostridia bacterium]